MDKPILLNFMNPKQLSDLLRDRDYNKNAFTLDDACRLAGMQPPSSFDSLAKWFAEQYGCEPVGTGRTTQMLLETIVDALNGISSRVEFFDATTAVKACAQTRRLLLRCYESPQSLDETTIMVGQATIAFTVGESTVRFKRGFHAVRQDHYRQKLAPPCLHRTLDNSRTCLLCQQPLRGSQLSKARIRRAIRRDHPEIAKRMGV